MRGRFPAKARGTAAAHVPMQKGWEEECEESGLAGHAEDGWFL